MNKCVALVVMNPMQLVSFKRMLGARDIAICSNRQTGKKKGTLTVQSVQSVRMLTWHDRTLTWQSPYVQVVDDDVAFTHWQIWANHIATHGSYWANGVVPRGPVMGCHVAPLYWLLFKILWSPPDSNPKPPP
jgi:hypothetical protein